MNTDFPFLQVRIARPTNQLERVVEFYRTGLGLPELYRFDDHDGYSGVMLGMPDTHCHLEFTQHQDSAPLPASSKDNLIVFYTGDTTHRDRMAQRLFAMGHQAVNPENPYWNAHGITIEDPDGWRIVLMATTGLKSSTL